MQDVVNTAYMVPTLSGGTNRSHTDSKSKWGRRPQEAKARQRAGRCDTVTTAGTVGESDGTCHVGDQEP